MMKHTKGPWVVAYKDKNGQCVVSAAHFEIATCWHHCVSSIEEEMHANAKLISAAPEMLEALQYLMTAHGEQLHDAFDMARKAIAKATGESNDPT